MNTTIDPKVMQRAERWLNGNISQESKAEIKEMIANNPTELTESFYCDLEFGTGGLRGIMGVGTNRINKYTVGMATQGLANYLRQVYPQNTNIRVAIAYDCRNNSNYFAQVAADVLSANGIQVFLFDQLRPTPELSFAVRQLNCHSGIVLTASHNPKEYNGYKVYWNDGAQLVPPHDKNVIIEVQKITSFEEVKFEGNPKLIQPIGETIDEMYLEKVCSYSLAPDLVKKHKDLKIVYTPLHGTGVVLMEKALRKFGFENISIVAEQAKPDGNFPTVHSPNPEESAAMELALNMARKQNADIVMATDPDSDRLAIGIKDLDGNYVLFNGNQTCSLITYYLIKQWQAKGKLTGNEFMVKTIVTSELAADIARKAGVESYDCLTGFKWIAEVIRKFEGKKQFIGGGEESFGYMVGDFVRDKDAITSCCVFAECAAWAKEKGLSLYELMIDIYHEYGLYKEKLVNVVRKGMSGQAEIKSMMENYRANPPREIAGTPVAAIKDYLLSKAIDFKTSAETPLDFPKSDVLQFVLEDGSMISVRPSGTEPKIKFYFSIKTSLFDKLKFAETDQMLETRMNDIITAMSL